MEAEQSKVQILGTPPTGEQVVKLAIVNGLLQIATTTTDAKGQTTANAYVVKFDGSDVPVNNQGTTRAFKWIDERTYEGATKVKGKPTTKTVYALARDGKTHTVTTTGTNAEGQTVNTMVVYEKQ